MIASQPTQEKLDEVRTALRVRDWSGPLDRSRPIVTEGPSWWYGDEDASQAFLREMGVRFDG